MLALVIKGIIKTLYIADKLVHAIQLLHDHGTGSTSAVADGCHTILAWLQLVKQSDEDTGARASESMAQGDGTTEHVHLGILETEDL